MQDYLNAYRNYSSSLTLLNPSQDTLATLDELKAHLGIDYDYDDSRLELLLRVATDWVESQTNRYFTEQVWRQTQHAFGCRISLAILPYTSVDVSYYDTSNELQTLDPDDYYLTPSGITSVSGFPSTKCRPDAVSVEITAGSDNVPSLAKALCLIVADHYNENREGQDLPKGLDRMVAMLRRGQAW